MAEGRDPPRKTASPKRPCEVAFNALRGPQKKLDEWVERHHRRYIDVREKADGVVSSRKTTVEDLGTKGKEKNVEKGKNSDPSVYSITTSDSPGMKLTTFILDGDNYLTWSRVMLTALRAMNKLPFIDGTLRKPDVDDPDRERWEICNARVVAWLCNTMEEELQASVGFVEDAKQLWDGLKERFATKSNFRTYKLMRDVYRLKQNGVPVSKYWDETKRLWDELDYYLEVPECTCGAAGKFAARREEEMSHHFLMGLDSAFDSVRLNILSLEPMPSFFQIHSMVVHHEDILKIGSVGLMQDQWCSDRPAEGRMGCDFCRKSNHTRNTCFALNGYPPRRRGKNRY